MSAAKGASTGAPDPVPAGRAPVADEVRRALLARRVVLLHGDLDQESIAEAAATILMLDATGDERIVLRMTGPSATVDAALVLMDVFDVTGVPVDTVGAGTITGGAVGILAAGRHRSLAPHARLRLLEPDTSVSGRATDIERALAARSSQRDRFLHRLSRCTGRPVAHLVEEWDSGAFLDAEDAVARGYADTVDTAPPREPERR